MEELIDQMLSADDEKAIVNVLGEASAALSDPATPPEDVERIRLAAELPHMRLEAIRLNPA